MDEIEAYNRLNKIEKFKGSSAKISAGDGQALRKGLEALNKQIPKEVSFSVKANSWICPTCREAPDSGWYGNKRPSFCPYCGQALDWNPVRRFEEWRIRREANNDSM